MRIINTKDAYPGPAPVKQKALKKHQYGKFENSTGITTGFHIKKYSKLKKKHKKSEEHLARAEILQTETPGYLVKKHGESVLQADIQKNVDLASASKGFELNLQFGPYKVDYTRNGRYLAIGGRRGHVAAFDWLTKKLMFETNVTEEVNDIKFLHQETMVAVAQKKHTFIYDNQGIELHCLKNLFEPLRLEFLPYHFLLVAATRTGFLHYLDVSVGEIVASLPTYLDRLSVVCQNPASAMILTGHATGTVCWWQPTDKRAVIKMFCHDIGIKSIAVDPTGKYLVTSGLERKMRVWDIRNTHEMVAEFKLPEGPAHMVFSQRNLLATAMSNSVQVFENVTSSSNPTVTPYLQHKFTSHVSSLQFCPFEDVLGCGMGSGVSSLLCPGAGEANFDALEEHPLQSKKHRQEREVKRLLDKVPYTMIGLGLEASIGTVHRASIPEQWEAKQRTLLGTPAKPTVTVNKGKQKGRSKDSKVVKRKDNMIYERKMMEMSALMSGTNKFYKKKSEYIKKPTNSILDVLSSKKF